jgi:hypothetical protein
MYPSWRHYLPTVAPGQCTCDVRSAHTREVLSASCCRMDKCSVAVSQWIFSPSHGGIATPHPSFGSWSGVEGIPMSVLLGMRLTALGTHICNGNSRLYNVCQASPSLAHERCRAMQHQRQPCLHGSCVEAQRRRTVPTGPGCALRPVIGAGPSGVRQLPRSCAATTTPVRSTQGNQESA